MYIITKMMAKAAQKLTMKTIYYKFIRKLTIIKMKNPIKLLKLKKSK